MDNFKKIPAGKSRKVSKSATLISAPHAIDAGDVERVLEHVSSPYRWELLEIPLDCQKTSVPNMYVDQKSVDSETGMPAEEGYEMTEYANYSSSELLEHINNLREIISVKNETVFMRMLHELQIHQMEIELQKRELLEIKHELKEARDHNSDLYDCAPLAYFTFDSHGSILKLNLAGARLLGRDKLGLLGTPFVNFIARHERRKFLNYVRDCASGGIKSSNEFELVIPDGKSIKIQTTMVDSQVERGYIDACRMSFFDVTECQLTELKLRLTSKILESTREGIMLTDAHSRIIAVNPAFLKTTGYNSEEIIGYTPSILKSGHHDEAFYQEMNAAFKVNDGWQGEIWNRRKNGEIYKEWASIKVLRKNDGEIDCYIGTFSDMSNQEEMKQRSKELAYYDELTGLANRSLLYDRLQHELAQSRRGGSLIAVLFLDLDHFKHVYDTRGHSVGDHILKEAAERLAYCVREGDTLSRLEGEEFVAILRNLSDIDVPAKVASRMVKALEKPFLFDSDELHITTSVGISVSPNDGDEVTVLLKNADTAMYCAKGVGKSNYKYYEADMSK